MTNAKKKQGRGSLKRHPFERFDIRETPDALIISEPPSPVLSTSFMMLFGIPMACLACFVLAFALRDGGAALVAALIFIPFAILFVVTIAIGGVNTRLVMITHDAIRITQQPISLRKRQIPLKGLQGFRVVKYDDGDGYVYQLRIMPSEYVLYQSSSEDPLLKLQSRIENFLGR
ncbi:MAG: hypothetical protein SNJ54_02790 [Anaerolineae bacterium]